MAETRLPSDEYVSTGIDGLDDILGGGILTAGFYLLQGDPGSGKTTVALQYLFTCARRGETALYVSLTESRSDLERICRSHGWNLDQIQVSDLTRSDANLQRENQYTVFNPSEVELSQTSKAVLGEVERLKPAHVVFDGLSEMRLLAGNPLRYRHQMLALKGYFEDRGTTVLLLDDHVNPFGEIKPESLVGGNIVMERYMPGYGGARRRIYVTKVRGAAFKDGYHDYEITRGGVVVHPRLVASEHAERFNRTPILSDVEGLDAMVGGGLETGTTTLMLGPAGAGKSTIAMQFVASHLVRGGRAAVYVFDEVLETLCERSEKLCRHGVRQFVETGSLHAQQVNPAQLSPGAFAHEVRQAVEEDGAQIVVIDSLNGYLEAMPEDRFLPTHLHELFAYLNQRGVLTIMVVAQHGLLSSSMADLDVSYLADTVFLLRYFEHQGSIRQAIGVFKRRTGPHERTLRELHITASGVSVGAPLTDFRGIMTGVPEYMAAAPANSAAERSP